MRKQAGGRENEEALRERIIVSGLNSVESLLSAREGGQPKSEVGA